MVIAESRRSAVPLARVGRCFLAGMLVLAAGLLRGQSTVSETERYFYAGNAGWIDARPAPGDGARVSEHVCAGYLYSANMGWIHLGDGSPDDGLAYNQATGTNYGVNVTTSSLFPGTLGRLRGYAYGANVGWIAFEDAGDPRVDLVSGRLSGHAYSANVGWINLGEFALSVATAVTRGADTDRDAISDHWEIAWFGGLGVAAGGTDFDGDGHSDYAEYVADTGPADAGDFLRITAFAFDAGVSPMGAEISFSSRPSRLYRVEFTNDLGLSPEGWQDSGFGAFSPDAGGETTRSFVTVAGARVFVRVRAERPLAP
jgi:hypothetical protein